MILTVSLGIGGPVASQSDTVHTKRYADGGIYKGTFRHGQQHGTGTYTLPNGYEYTGEWVNGEIRGQGVARFPNGSVYEGEFAKGQPNGIGKIVFTDGGTYEGGWVDGKITGTGIALYANGARYEGEFLNAVHHGRGLIQYAGGAVYDGEWAKGVVEGEGKLTYADGAVYHGLFSQGEPNGRGVLTMSDGMVYTGVWLDGEITSVDTPDFRKIIDRLDYIDAADKAATTELLQTAFMLIGGMEPDGAAALLGISAGDFAADFLRDPQTILAATGSDIFKGAGEIVFAQAAGDIVEEYMFKAGPLSELPDQWQVPLRTLVDATIVESVGLLATGADLTGAALVGPIVDRLNNVREIYQATNELSKAQALGLFAIVNGAEITAALVHNHPSEEVEKLKVDWLAAVRGNISDIVGADDAGAAYQITVLGFRALDAHGRGDTEGARGEIDKMIAIGDAAQGLTPLSVEGPLDLPVRLASGGKDSPKVLVEMFLQSTALSSLNDRPSAPNYLDDSLEVRFSSLGSSYPARRKLRADGCSHETFYSRADSFRWTGLCSNGRISGGGTLRFYQGAMVTHLVHVGDNTDLELSGGRLYHSEDINFQLQYVGAAGGARIGGHEILNVTIAGPDRLNVVTPDALDHIIKKVSESPEMVQARSNYYQSRGKRTPWTFYIFSRNEFTRGFKLLLSDTGEISSTGSTYDRNVPRSLERLLKKENEVAVQQQRAQQARDQAQLIANLQQQREEEWQGRWSAQLVRDDPWPNTADMLRFDLSGTLVALQSGQRIRITAREISTSSERVFVRSNQRFTNIYEGIPKAQMTLSEWYKFTQSVGQRLGYVVSCSLPFRDLSKISEGQTYVVDAKLISFNKDRLDLACTNPR